MSAPDYLAQLRHLKKEEINTPSPNCINPVKDFTQFMQIIPSAQKMIFSDEQKVIDKCESDPSALEYLLRRYAEDCPPDYPGDDNRRSCQHCGNLSGDQCRAIQGREIKPSWNHNRDLMRRCPGFAPKADDPDQRKACDRWPGLF